MALYEATVVQMTKMLENLDRWLAAGEAHAQEKKYDAAVLLGARLAPDQYPLTRQVQAACDAAKFCAARLSGAEPPRNPDTEQTLAELHARIASTLAFLGTVTAKQFAGSDERVVPLSFMPGKGLRGEDYASEMALPNFYFHVTTAYAILRHNGVNVGKSDYLGSLKLREV